MAASDIRQSGIPFSLDPKSGVPYYKQIILQIEMAIADGRLTTGDQLPTVRSLAVTLKINPNTVARAYSELEIRNLVTTQQGTGTFISDKEVKLSEVEREEKLEEMVRTFLSRGRSYGFSPRELAEAVRRAGET
ncbi:GntR family transcriptional regulator [Salinispira pacifica]|uniref:Transcriptional regulator, GntR family n=1 Tax=Salinispira pacifica TaxID=1307761 RepID=V5WJ63_9SPIO|nr:GntR family transcriptional regulator [Salinispira pacifica]AHC15579.1 Transcriptional regulator, GntR family [Salinispira pacifica]